MQKKADVSDKSEKANIKQYRQFIGKTWRDVLREHDLEQYISIFENKKLTDIDTILSLTEHDFEKIGIEMIGDRKRLIKVLHEEQNINYI
jgi:hypothetical protein